MKQFDHTTYLSDVRIIDKYDPHNYLVQVGESGTFTLKFCDDYAPDLDPGMLLTELVYEDRGSCKSISDQRLGYKVWRNRLGKFIHYQEATNE